MSLITHKCMHNQFDVSLGRASLQLNNFRGSQVVGALVKLRCIGTIQLVGQYIIFNAKRVVIILGLQYI